MYDLIGGRATWTALGMPTEGSLGDRRRIAHYVEPAGTVPFKGTVADIGQETTSEETGPVAVVNAGGVLLGSLDPHAARRLPADTPVARALAPSPNTIRPELRIEEVVTRLRDDSLDHVFVTTVSGVLLGVVFRDQLHV